MVEPISAAILGGTALLGGLFGGRDRSPTVQNVSSPEQIAILNNILMPSLRRAGLSAGLFPQSPTGTQPNVPQNPAFSGMDLFDIEMANLGMIPFSQLNRQRTQPTQPTNFGPSIQGEQGGPLFNIPALNAFPQLPSAQGLFSDVINPSLTAPNVPGINFPSFQFPSAQGLLTGIPQPSLTSPNVPGVGLPSPFDVPLTNVPQFQQTAQPLAPGAQLPGLTTLPDEFRQAIARPFNERLRSAEEVLGLGSARAGRGGTAAEVIGRLASEQAPQIALTEFMLSQPALESAAQRQFASNQLGFQNQADIARSLFGAELGARTSQTQNITDQLRFLQGLQGQAGFTTQAQQFGVNQNLANLQNQLNIQTADQGRQEGLLDRDAIMEQIRMSQGLQGQAGFTTQGQQFGVNQTLANLQNQLALQQPDQIRQERLLDRDAIIQQLMGNFQGQQQLRQEQLQQSQFPFSVFSSLLGGTSPFLPTSVVQPQGGGAIQGALGGALLGNVLLNNNDLNFGSLFGGTPSSIPNNLGIASNNNFFPTLTNNQTLLSGVRNPGISLLNS